MQVGDIVTGLVSTTNKTHFIVELDNGVSGLVHISEISDYYVSKIDSMFRNNKKYTFEVIEIMTDKKVRLSWKALKPRFQKDPFKFVLKETSSGFRNIIMYTNKEINND